MNTNSHIISILDRVQENQPKAGVVNIEMSEMKNGEPAENGKKVNVTPANLRKAEELRPSERESYPLRALVGQQFKFLNLLETLYI